MWLSQATLTLCNIHERFMKAKKHLITVRSCPHAGLNLVWNGIIINRPGPLLQTWPSWSHGLPLTMTVRLIAMVNYCSKSLAKDSANIGGYGCATIVLNFLDWPGWLESPDKTSCLHLVNWHNAGIFLLRGGALHFLPENKRSQMGLASESSIQIAKRVGFLYGAPNAHIVMLTSWLSCISCREGIYRNFA